MVASLQGLGVAKDQHSIITTILNLAMKCMLITIYTLLLKSGFTAVA